MFLQRPKEPTCYASFATKLDVGCSDGDQHARCIEQLENPFLGIGGNEKQREQHENENGNESTTQFFLPL